MNGIPDINHMLPSGCGFGLGFSVVNNPALAGKACSPGTIFWGGIFGTNFFLDPNELCIGVSLTQRFPSPLISWKDFFMMLVMQALI